MKIDWKNKHIKQQPNWENQVQLDTIIDQIANYPNLVSIDEIQQLKTNLINVSKGHSFILQGGDCAETFSDFSSSMIKNKLKVLLQMSAIIHYSNKINVIKVGRIAGQFAKPRSSNYEVRDKLKLPIYRGDAVNSIKFNRSDRDANPKRLLQAYHQSAATMNLIRNLMMEGFTDLSNIQSWSIPLIEKSEYGEKYFNIVQQIKEIFQFNNPLGILKKMNIHPNIVNQLFTSHEALLLDYESAFIESNDNLSYDCSSHMVWVGDRTRFIDSAHIEFVANIANPIGIKIGPTIDIIEFIKLCKIVNPNNEEGKLILIIRLGVNYIEQFLPQLIEQIQNHRLNVIWMSDPMHGNTIESKNGYKTRNFDTIKLELESFFAIHQQYGTIPGGVHFELTGDNVTECLGGINNVKDIDLQEYYQTACDPRLNNEQSLEMGFLIADLLQKRRN